MPARRSISTPTAWENGNAEKGLSDGVGAGEGAWRLQLSSGLDMEVLSYVRTSDGFLTSMHDTVPSAGGRHRVAFFNPGSNASQVSRLRLVNPGEEAAEVSIVGVDDQGESPGSEVTTTIPAGASRTFTATALESGGEGLEGALGDGEGKWRLMVESAHPIVAMSLLSDPMGYLTNLSTAPGREPQGPADLVVVSPSVSNNGPVAGATFTLSATVRNDGDAPSPVTALRYYRSSDATIATTDRAVGTDAVAGLAASGSASASVELSAPSTPGTYYYGACVDAVAEEFDTTNNCPTSVEVDVQESESESGGQPDLMVASPTVSDDGPAAGTTFTLSVTVSNAGDGTSPSAMMGYYRSSDATITTSDTPAGADEVAELGVSGSDSKSVELTAPSTPGTYYYGACVDAVTKESDTTNNCSTAVDVNVPKSEPQSDGHPDLSVPAVSVAASPGGTYTNDSFTVSATVRNDGNGDSAATTLRYYRSGDATITTSDTEVGTDEVAALAATASGSESVELTAPSTPGTYYYGACVDAVAEESDTTNNCSTSVKVDVEEPPKYPDLVVRSPSVQFSSQHPGATFTLSATVKNEGGGASPATILRYYQSTDAAISTSDTEVDTDAVEALAALGTSRESVDLIAPTTPGRYYYGACVDAVTGESDTINNCSTPVHITVTQPSDLVVGSPSVGDSSQAPGATFTLSAAVENEGSGASLATILRYYRSTDAAISTSDTEVDTDGVWALGPSGTSSQSVDLTAPTTPGTYYYGACVDAVTGESDTTISTSDTEVDTDTVDTLAASGTSSESVDLKAPSTPGTYSYGACVDAVAGESDTTNNCSTSVQVTVVALPDDCAASTSTTCQIRVAGSTSGAIENGGDRDWIRITGQPSHGLLVSGHRYLFRVRGRGTIAHGVWIDALDHPVFEVLDSTGASLVPRVAYESTSGTPEVEFVAGATQVYYVAVSGFESSDTGGYLVQTVNTTSSTIQQLQFRSDPGADDTYSVNDEITVRVIFSSGATVTGTPQLALDIGGVTRQASYTGGTGDLTFSYTVAEGDSDTDGIAISANSLTTPTGSSIRAGGMDVPLQHDAVPADSGHKVDGSTTAQAGG